MKSLNQIIAELEDFATAHWQIHTFGHGDVWEISPQSSGIVYPVLWMVPQTATPTLNEVVDEFTVLCMDLVDSGERNETEVLSDTRQIILDVCAYYRQTHTNSYIIEFGGSIQPFTERDPERVSGHSLTIRIKQPHDYNLCAVPANTVPVPPIPSCADATVQNAASNPTYQASVASGGVLVLPQLKVLDSDGVTPILANYMPNTSGYVVTCTPPTCADATLQQNTIQRKLIPSGATFNLITKLNGVADNGVWDGVDTIDFTSGASGSVSVAVSDATPSTGETITITATPTGFTPTNHIFFTFDGSTIEFIAEQASGVYNWLVDRVGTYDIYVLATDGIIEAYGTIGVIAASGYVLDLITPQPVWAISLRRLRSGYTGDACIVRRSSDNTTLAIGFIGEHLDTATLTGFVGVGNGFTATMYNQMGTGNDAAQVTAGSQPAIVVSGTVQLLGGKPTIVFNGTSSEMVMTSTITFSHCLVVARKSANVNSAQAVIGGGAATAFYFGGTLGGGYNSVCVDTPAGSLFSGVNNTSPHQSSLRLGGAGSGRIRVDGVTAVTGTTSATMIVSRVGTRSDLSLRHVGDISEIILYASVLSDANELIIENNQRAYYGL